MGNSISSAIDKVKKASIKTKVIFILLLCYLALVLLYTVFMRTADFYGAQLDLFWSYKNWLAGNWNLGREIIYNIGMLVPFGFLLTATLSSRKRLFLIVFVTGLLFSCLIEILQFELMRGLFEYDDIFNNTLGAVLGYLAYQFLQKLTKGRNTESIALSLGAIIVVAGILFCINGNTVNGIKKEKILRGMCFQVDRAVLDGNRLTLTGFVFRYNEAVFDYGITLRSTKTGKEMRANVEYGLLRKDVAGYFNGKYDYAKTGFVATILGIHADEEYEVFVNPKRYVSVPTGVYVTGTGIHFAKQDGFIAPIVTGTDFEEIVNNGYLRVYRPDRACYVYQYKGCLYWIADKAFHFENNGKTYIQYHLWTTQTEKLPQIRLKNHWYWDNIGGLFEKNEITHVIDCGRYRVCKRKIPVEYSVTSIVTGYHKDGKWIWYEYFRPIYEL